MTIPSAFPGQFRRVGALHQFSWSVPNPLANPVIDGVWDAAFAALEGTDTLEIDVGAGPVVVTFAGTETDATDAAATINGTSGLSGVASVITDGADERLRLTSTGGDLSCGDHSSRDVFLRTGLPQEDRFAGSTTSFRVPLQSADDRLDLISEPFEIPPGANFIDLFFRSLSFDDDGSRCRVVYSVVEQPDPDLSSTIGDPAFMIAVPEAPLASIDDTGGSIDLTGNDPTFIPEAGMLKLTDTIGPDGALVHRIRRVPVFGTTAALRILVATLLAPEGGDNADLPRVVPWLSVWARAVAA